MAEESDSDSMFAAGSDDADGGVDKEVRSEDNGGSGDGNAQGGGTKIDALSSSSSATTAQHPKSRLSKWAARLFDPDRPRGLVEAPQVIPLNDEFLTAFGRREKEYDERHGRSLEVVRDEGGGGENDNETEDDEHEEPMPISERDTKDEEGARTVRFANLAYRTSAAKLQEECQKYGSVVSVNMILNEDQQAGPNNHNSGRAFVLFESKECAEDCANGLKELDGRELRVATLRKNGQSSSNSGRPKPSSLLSRYWEKDISTICRRCNEVGHKETDCKKLVKPKPCPLCAAEHDLRDCPLSRVCFNCGIPGHVSRECKYPRGSIRRLVCGICFRSGHHRIRCRERAKDAPTRDAVCMVCYQPGHFMCKDMKWFYPLDGVSCFNCGQRGHSGYDCRRPTLSDCNRNPSVVATEVDRAPAMEQEIAQREQERGRPRDADDSNSRKRQNRSMPPQISRGQSGGDRGYSREDNRPSKRSRGYK